MDNTNENPRFEAEQEGYVPRPKWQVWGSRLALVIFLIIVAMQIIGIARGGL